MESLCLKGADFIRPCQSGRRAMSANRNNEDRECCCYSREVLLVPRENRPTGGDEIQCLSALFPLVVMGCAQTLSVRETVA
jgi:hypothetical protein